MMVRVTTVAFVLVMANRLSWGRLGPNFADACCLGDMMLMVREMIVMRKGTCASGAQQKDR